MRSKLAGTFVNETWDPVSLRMCVYLCMCFRVRGIHSLITLDVSAFVVGTYVRLFGSKCAMGYLQQAHICTVN